MYLLAAYNGLFFFFIVSGSYMYRPSPRRELVDLYCS
jgi:hypothetical protein